MSIHDLDFILIFGKISIKIVEFSWFAFKYSKFYKFFFYMFNNTLNLYNFIVSNVTRRNNELEVLIFLSSWHLVIFFPQDLKLAIGRARPGQQWARPKSGQVKIDLVFSGQNFNSPTRPKNRAGRAK